jgi:P-type Ca2+ transporter type 2C
MKEKPRNPKESFFAGGAGVQGADRRNTDRAAHFGGVLFGLYEHGYSMGAQDNP